jgi:hypothetical protein
MTFAKQIDKLCKSLLTQVATDYQLNPTELIAKYLEAPTGPAANGGAYERLVHSVIHKCTYQGERFCTQTVEELGGSGAGQDHQCARGVNVESKKYPNPDWTQIVLTHNGTSWTCGKGKKLHPAVREEFSRVVGQMDIWGGKVPSFIQSPVTHERWLQEKSDFQDVYIPCESTQIASFYRKKGSAYIQVAGGKGLYHTGEDPLSLGVPFFECPQQIRIRVKIHGTKNKAGNANLSVTAACQPVSDISLVSPYSLDNSSRLPPSLVYDHNL